MECRTECIETGKIKNKGVICMKCSFCKKEFTPEYTEDVCEECIHSVNELSNGKEESEDE